VIRGVNREHHKQVCPASSDPGCDLGCGKGFHQGVNRGVTRGVTGTQDTG
jgi:hypothetical protein